MSDMNKYVTTAGGEAREYDVTAQMNLQDKLTQELYEYAAKLEDRLTRVLRENMPVANKDAAAPNNQLVQLAEQLRSHNDRLSDVLARLNGMLNRLEL
jgi:hypothetical protein